VGTGRELPGRSAVRGHDPEMRAVGVGLAVGRLLDVDDGAAVRGDLGVADPLQRQKVVDGDRALTHPWILREEVGRTSVTFPPARAFLPYRP